jgi:flagellar motor protein MotB
MPAQSWATPAQLAFLNDKRVEFANAQREKRLAAFWPSIYHDFFAIWTDRASEILPDTEDASKKKKKKVAKVDEAETEEQWIDRRKNVRALRVPAETILIPAQNIYHWFNNHGLHKGRRAGKVNTVKITAASASSRVSALTHLYSKKYYETRVKEHVDRELAGRNVDEGQRLTIVNKHLTRIFENESPEVKEEIRKLQNKERRARDEAKDIEKHLASSAILTPEQLLM